MKTKILLGSPTHLGILGTLGLKFLCLNIPKPCPYQCKCCGVRVSSLIEKHDLLSEETITSIIESAFSLGILTIAILSDGEPLFRNNLNITKKIAQTTGKLGMNFIIHTKGALLNKKMLDDLEILNPKTSFAISINSLKSDCYKELHGKNTNLDIIKKNAEYWKLFLNKHNYVYSDNIISKIAFHNVITKVNVEEIDDLKNFANECGAVFIATFPYWQGEIVKNKSFFGNNEEQKDIVAKYSSTGGPIAIGQNSICSYMNISNNNIHGITIHTKGGVPLLCPYLLTECIDWLRISNYPKVSTDKWLLAVEKTSKQINEEIFEKFGWHNCLMRHPRLEEIKIFLPTLIKEIKNSFKEEMD